MSKYYAGVTGERHGEVQVLEVFTAAQRPTKHTHGGRYKFAYGPFKTLAALKAWFKARPELSVELRSRHWTGDPMLSGEGRWATMRKRNSLISGGGIHDATGLPLNPDGTVTLYHHTSAEKASKIRQTGLLKSAAEPDVYLTTRKEADTGYGGTSVAVRVKPELLQLDDEFPDGRKDYRIDTGRPGGSIKVLIDNPRQRIPEAVLRWREKQRKGRIMSPSTFRKIELAAKKAGYDDPKAVAGKAYWETLKAKYRRAKDNPIPKGLVRPDAKIIFKTLEAHGAIPVTLIPPFYLRGLEELQDKGYVVVSEGNVVLSQTVAASALHKKRKRKNPGDMKPGAQYAPRYIEILGEKAIPGGLRIFFRLTKPIQSFKQVEPEIKDRYPRLRPYQWYGAKKKGEYIVDLRQRRINKNFDPETFATLAAASALGNVAAKKMMGNPPRGAKKIYDDILEIRAKKGEESLWPGELFKHKFEPRKGKASIYGMPDGSLLVKGKKRLWKEFDYSERRR